MNDIVDEGALPALLERFYGLVRADAELGPVFEAAVGDWPAHLARLADFWSSIMLTSGRYKGNPMAEHLRHADRITAPMFDRWLALWRQATAERLAPAAAAAMVAKAERIAESLQLALKLRTPEGRRAMLDRRPASMPYRSTPVFEAGSLPKALQRAHATRAGVWGVVRVLDGQLRLTFEADGRTAILDPGTPGRLDPEELHHVEPIGAMRMRVDFYDHPPILNP